MAKNNGWIRLHRKFQEHRFWSEPRKFSRAEAWIDIIMEARWKEDSAQAVFGNTVISCERGQVLYSLDTWAARWGWTKSATRRFLVLLKNMGQIDTENVTQTTRITICNYARYQDTRNADEPEMKRKRNASETQAKPTEEGKQRKKGNKKPTAGKIPKKTNPFADAFKTAFDTTFPVAYAWKDGDFPQYQKWRKEYPDVTPEQFTALARYCWGLGEYMPGASLTIRGLCSSWATLQAKRQARESNHGTSKARRGGSAPPIPAKGQYRPGKRIDA